jgi:catechol 2,3-dioxygenase-like lactoylglutathione lyase family enzyme
VDLVSLRMITDDVDRTVQFYEQITGAAAVRYTPVFAELVMPSCTLAIGHTQTTQLFGQDSARPADNPPSSSSSASTTSTASISGSSRW